MPNIQNAWLTEGLQADFEGLLPIGSKETKTQQSLEVKAIFKNYGRGVATCRDEWMYDFDKVNLTTKVEHFITNYNAEVERWKQHKDKKTPIDDFLSYDDSKYKWSEGLKGNLIRLNKADFHSQEILPAMTRPFCKAWLYFDRTFVERVYQMPQILPTLAATQENLAISITAPGCTKSFHSLMTNCLPDLHLTGDTQCFPLYTYALDGKIRRDNITDWALSQFRAKYGPDVSKPDIFHYVYALLHHPEYRARYKENLKRELPRVPLVGASKSEQERARASKSEQERARASKSEQERARASKSEQERARASKSEQEQMHSNILLRPGNAWRRCMSATSRRRSMG